MSSCLSSQWPLFVHNACLCPTGLGISSGELPTVPRERSMSQYFDTGSVLIESATDVFRVDAALATLGDLIPGLHYFRSAQLTTWTAAMASKHSHLNGWACS